MPKIAAENDEVAKMMKEKTVGSDADAESKAIFFHLFHRKRQTMKIQ